MIVPIIFEAKLIFCSTQQPNRAEFGENVWRGRRIREAKIKRIVDSIKKALITEKSSSYMFIEKARNITQPLIIYM